MSAYRWRSYCLELVTPDHRGGLFLSNIAEVRTALEHLSASCTHSGVTYRLERVWLDNGFAVEPPPGEGIALPPTLESECACKLSGAVR